MTRWLGSLYTGPMRCKAAVFVIPLALIALAVVVGLMQPWAPAGPVYTVAQVQAGLLHHPKAWVGRIIRVEGAVVLVSWSFNWGGNAPGGTSGDGCVSWTGCVLHVPRGQKLHLYLVAPGGPDSTAELQAVRVGLLLQHDHVPFPLSVARQYRPNLVLSARLARPNVLFTGLSRLPLVGSWMRSLTRRQDIVHGGTPRVYHVQLVSAPTTRCSQAPCDEGVLLDSPP